MQEMALFIGQHAHASSGVGVRGGRGEGEVGYVDGEILQILVWLLEMYIFQKQQNV